MTLYRNSTGVAYGVNNAEESNQTPATEQTINYTACYPESQNYSQTCSIRYAFYITRLGGGGGGGDEDFIPTPTPMPEPSVTPSPTPTPTPEPSVTPTAGPSVEPSGQPWQQQGTAVSNASETVERAKETLACFPEKESIIQTTRTIKTYRAGDKIYSVITLTVKNTGSALAKNIRVEENIPAGNVFFQTPPKTRGEKTTWVIETLNPGESKIIVYTIDRKVGAENFQKPRTIAETVVLKTDYAWLYYVIAAEALIVIIALILSELGRKKRGKQKENSQEKQEKQKEGSKEKQQA